MTEDLNKNLGLDVDPVTGNFIVKQPVSESSYQEEEDLKAGAVETENNFPDYFFMKDPEQRRLLAERVDQLVEIASHNKANNLIFLDKSARPLVVLFKDLWKARYPDSKEPNISFINVGMEISKKKVSEQMEKKGQTSYDDDRRYYISRLHGGSNLEDALGLTQEELDTFHEKYKYLEDAEKLNQDGQKSEAVIVDEYSYSGNSLAVAKIIVGAAFPDLPLDTYSISKGEGNLFHYIDRHGEPRHDPPWRAWENENPWFAGVTGVIDPREGNPDVHLTARPYYDFDENARFKMVEDQVDKISKGLRSYWKHGQDIVKEISLELDRFKEYSSSLGSKAKEPGITAAINDAYENDMSTHLEKITSDVVLYCEIKNKLTEFVRDNGSKEELIQIFIELGDMEKTLGNDLNEFVGVEIVNRNYQRIYEFVFNKYIEPLKEKYHLKDSYYYKESLNKLTEFLKGVYGIYYSGKTIREADIFKLYTLGPDGTHIKPYITQLRKEMHSIARDHLESADAG